MDIVDKIQFEFLIVGQKNETSTVYTPFKDF
jgi:hypothetical protein